MADSNPGRILEIQRMSTEDGPGLRTTVFFKGCPLSCAWCHNPESISMAPELVWEEAGCLGCGLCQETCPNQALTLSEKGVAIDRKRCQACGRCADHCPAAALSLLGREWTVPELVEELKKDQAYFMNSGGGVTLSGGEAALQHRFIAPVLAGLKGAGISTALDTCGHLPFKVLDDLLPGTDLLLYDLKEMDPGRHRAFTGADNTMILDNLIQLAPKLKEQGNRLWIRTPVIPGATDREENILGIAAIIRRHLEGLVERWELCAFNPLGQDKYRRLGKTWAYDHTPSLAQDRMEVLKAAAVKAGADPARVYITGPMAGPEKERP